MYYMTEDEFMELSNSNMGFCESCEEFEDGVEPDALNYKCPWCGNRTLVGLEMALIHNTIVVEE